MTLARTALRLAAVGALEGVSGARPTIAGKRVFDSRVGDLDFKNPTDRLPILIVTTDGDEGTPQDMKDGISQRGGPPFWRNPELIIEMSMVIREGEGDDFVIGYPVTDAQLEIQLDFLEAQVWRTLSAGTSPMAIAFRRTGKPMAYESHRAASDEHGNRAAARTLTFKCRLSKDDCPAPHGATGLDALPDPLRTVAKALPPGSYAADACAGIAAALAAEAIGADPVPPLAGIGLAFDFAPAGTGDGAADVTADLTLSPE